MCSLHGYERLADPRQSASGAYKKNDKQRKYIEERIKSGHLRLEISVEPKYDLSQIKPKVQNGLLTVNVPLAKIPEPKVTKYTVE